MKLKFKNQLNKKINPIKVTSLDTRVRFAVGKGYKGEVSWPGGLTTGWPLKNNKSKDRKKAIFIFCLNQYIKIIFCFRKENQDYFFI